MGQNGSVWWQEAFVRQGWGPVLLHVVESSWEGSGGKGAQVCGSEGESFTPWFSGWQRTLYGASWTPSGIDQEYPLWSCVSYVYTQILIRFSLKIFSSNNTLPEGLEPCRIPVMSSLMNWSLRFMVRKDKVFLTLLGMSPEKSGLRYLWRCEVISKQRETDYRIWEIWFGDTF